MSNPINDAKNWMGGAGIPLTGFSWKIGKKGDTAGIVVWSDVFLATNKDGEKVAIILMDNQGLSETGTTPADNKRIFSFGNLISSVLIFNIMRLIEESHLDLLQSAIYSARSAHKNNQNLSKTKPFQKLFFLIRDWCCPSDNSFGFEGGNSYIMEQLEINDDQLIAQKSIREYIFSSFEDVSCCLLPEPGKSVKDASFDGSWSMMETDFKEELKILIETLLHPNKLVIKKLNNEKPVGAELKKFIENSLDFFKLNENVCNLTPFEIQLQLQMNTLIENGLENYEIQLSKNQYMNINAFLELIDGDHCIIKGNVLDQFAKEIPMIAKEQQMHFKNILEAKIGELFKALKKGIKINFEKIEAKEKFEKERKKCVKIIMDNSHENTCDATLNLAIGMTTIVVGAIVATVAAPVAAVAVVGLSSCTLHIGNALIFWKRTVDINDSEKKKLEELAKE